jgi:hypothetical protein
MRLRPGESLVLVTVPVKLAKGETAVEAIEAVREEIAAIHQEMLAVRRAPAPA